MATQLSEIRAEKSHSQADHTTKCTFTWYTITHSDANLIISKSFKKPA